MLARESKGRIWWQLLGILLLIVAGMYAALHPHSFFYYLVKFIATPTP